MQGKRAWAEIDLDNLAFNVQQIKSVIKKGEYMAVVKADAYGHGAAVLSPYLERLGINHFAVSNIEEAEELRRAGVVSDILILGYTDVDLAVELFEQNITQAVFSLEYAKALNSAAKRLGVKINVHIKVDTGMGRIGFNCKSTEGIDKSIDQILEVLSLKSLNVTGIFTHFAESDEEAEEAISWTKKQFELFNKTAAEIKLKTGKNLIMHCCNTAATLFHQEMQLSLQRIGISMYGLNPNKELKLPIKIKPVMSFKTIISQIKTVNMGESVSYGRTFIADKECVIATLPVGYADGYPRNLSNIGSCYVNGKKARIVGRICMDQMMIDITGITAKEGDTVELFGGNILAEEVAEKYNTINYELVCSVSRRVPRIYIKNGKIIRIENYISG